MLPAPPLFNVNYFINPPLAPFACNNSLYVSLLCPVFCVLHPASCVRLYTSCVTIVSAMPSNHCTGPLCIAPSCRLCICCTFSAITISDILSPSNSESRSHVPCPALRVLRLASYVRLCALFPVFVSTLPSIYCAASMPLASLVPPLAPCHTSPLQLWFILPYGNSKHCAPSFSPLQPRI